MRSSPSAFGDNLRQPMPLGRKVRLVFRNLVLQRARIPPATCCGHPGEPGC